MADCKNADCLNNDTLCYKCNGISFYKQMKSKTPKMRKSKRAGSSLERQSVSAHLQSNSGAGYRKGDVETNNLLIECKATGKQSMTVKREWLETNFKDALMYGKISVLNFQFGGDEQIYSIVRNEDLIDLLSLLDD